jgi:capsular exopolysaccharide synthesis family protein
MSRIQDILSKAERDGTVRRTRAFTDDARPTSRPLSPVPSIGHTAEDRSAPHTPSVVATGGWATASGNLAPVLAPPPSERTLELDSRLVAALAPTSLAAEQYRSLRTRIKRSEGNRSIRTMVVTSPSKGDGKSLTAANLALTMGQEFQQRILLVDADLRRPTINRLFGIEEGPGLADVLMGGAELDQVLVPLAEYHLTVLPAGTLPSHPAELLGSSAMRRVLDTLRNRFDRILIDMPPVAPLADLHIVAPLVDGLLMIVRAGITPKPAIERALAGLDVSKVLGLVLNESGSDATTRDAYQGYGYIAG